MIPVANDNGVQLKAALTEQLAGLPGKNVAYTHKRPSNGLFLLIIKIGDTSYDSSGPIREA